MAIKAKLANMDGLSDAVKALYRKDGEHFVLDVEPVDGFALENVQGLKSALLKERETVANLSAGVESFKGIDAAKAREALEKVKSMDSWTPSEKANELIEKRGKDVAAMKDAEYAPKVKAYEATRKAYESLVIGKALEDAATKHKFTVPALVPKLFGDAVRLEEKDGVFTPVIIGADGKAIMKLDGQANSRPLSIDEFIAEKAKDPMFAPLIAGTTATGTGSRTPQSNGNGHTNPSNPFAEQAAATETFNSLLTRRLAAT